MKKFADHCDLTASVDDIAGAIMSEDYLRYRYDTEYTASFELEIHQNDDESFAYHLRRELAVGERVPKIVSSVVGSSFTMLQEAHWRKEGEQFVGKAKLTSERFKGGVNIDIVIEALDEQGCRLSFEGHLSVDMPLIGRQLERMMADKVSESFADSIEAIEGYLEQQN